jgi:hypothetical protein
MIREADLSQTHAARLTYLYRAVDSFGDTIDFMLSPKLDWMTLNWNISRFRHFSAEHE